MCGIVGYIGQKPASEILISGLQKLEYRGYDSAGIATILDGSLHCVRAKGKLQTLKDKIQGQENPSSLGIGHTRWATHGKPEEHNAHPHRDQSERLAVVQNGIVENYRDLRETLRQKGYSFRSETDTEVIPHLIADKLKHLKASEATVSPLFTAVQAAVSQLDGAFAIAVVSADFPGELIVARQQAPLVIGYGDQEYYCASDTPALIAYTRAILPLENEEIGRLTTDGVEVYGFNGDRLRKSPQTLNWNPMMVEKQGFKHFMLKEIYEQPGVVRACLESYLDPNWSADSKHNPVTLSLDADLVKDLEQVQILSCGTSWHAGMVGKYLLEQLAQVPTQVHYASEFRYSPTPLMANTLTIGVTQSGETADTLAALEMEKTRRLDQPAAYQARLIGITNRPESSLARLVPQVIDTRAGIEIGVAATKTFVAQVVAFYLLALDLSYT
ncbi:MAG: glutamine--fructose-6-phosphate transaminase (isomerizing), partial [Cyanobacteria bacterium P01_F01_bin.42]